MANELFVYNTLIRKKVKFEPLNPPFVGMYVCGPTVYSHAHLGNARPAITFDILYRYLNFLGYKVRYVSNITDVGHLEGDTDDGEDKLIKKAKLEKLEPMEIAQQFMNSYHEDMAALNVIRPNIEPRATGHIPEQIEMIEKIMQNGYAYEANGSVYFDVNTYNTDHNYGELSGRDIEDLISGTRELTSQDEKKSSLDFALWKKADQTHLMRWNSPWGLGFPGWHLECSVMSTKYLGDEFDIHGGGLDLLFPHHDCEIAQSMGGLKCKSVKYWMHNNMLTMNGQKMAKSLGNTITLKQFFTGEHDMLERTYHPMIIRFLILQAHYRSTLDFSNEALQAAEKGYNKLVEAYKTLQSLSSSDKSTVDIKNLEGDCRKVMNDDLNTPMLIANLFEGVKIINSVNDKKETISAEDLSELKSIFDNYLVSILGLKVISSDDKNDDVMDGLMNLILEIRDEARTKKDFDTSDKIRDQLNKINLEIKDGKDGSNWVWKN
ncbi:MAG: cysteine--tRNA ligase [Bacteroidia bacterium]|nr:cysteine--tRNA ligase [Bacteroidia bacterium]